jgi:hypothetical protein
MRLNLPYQGEQDERFDGAPLTALRPQANEMSEVLAHADAKSGNGGALNGDSKAAAREVPYFTNIILLNLPYPTLQANRLEHMRRARADQAAHAHSEARRLHRLAKVSETHAHARL